MHQLTLKIQAKLTEELSKFFEFHGEGDICFMSDLIERTIPSILENFIIDYTALIVRNSRADYTQYKCISISDKKFVVRISDSLLDRTELIIGYFEFFKSSNAPELERRTVEISGYGQYNKFTVIYPTVIKIDEFILLDTVKIIFETAYLWLYNKVKSSILKNCLHSASIYSYLKSLFPGEHEVHNSIWLVTVRNNILCYLLDTETVGYSVGKIKRSAFFDIEAPIKQIGELIAMRLKFEGTYTNEAAKTDSKVDGNPLDGKYASKNTLLAIGEAGIFDGNATCFPIVNAEGRYLFAVLPTKFADEVIPILTENKTGLTNEFLKVETKLGRIFELMRRKNYELGDLGKFFGNFGGYFGLVYFPPPV